MISAIRQNLSHFCFRNSSSLPKSTVVFYLPLRHFSTSGEEHSTRVYDFLVHMHHFSPKSASEIASVVTHLRNPERSDSLLSFLKQTGFSNSQLEKALKKCPQLISKRLDRTIKPRIKIFHDFGLPPGDVVEIFANNPEIFSQSLNKRIIPSLSVLKSFFGLNELSNLRYLGWFFRSNLNDTLVPNVEFLKNCGVSMDRLVWLVRHYPTSLMCKPEKFKKLVDKVDATGISRSSKLFVSAIRHFASFSDENWELKFKSLREMGFSDDDMATAFRKSPGVFSFTVEALALKVKTLREMGFSNDNIAATFRNMPEAFHLSEKRIKKAIEILLANGKFDLSAIARNPVSLTLSIEKRIKPRLQLLELLESKNLIQGWPGLGSFCCMSNDKFYEKYVAPFRDEIGDVFIVKSAT